MSKEKVLSKESVFQSHNITIDILRLICAILVIGIHTETYHDTLRVHMLRLEAIAVPFFAIVSGYFFIQNFSSKGYKYAFKYVMRLLLVYLGWSCFLYSMQMYSQLKWGGKLWMNWRYLFIDQARLGHLWYVIALVCIVCLFCFLYKMKCKKLLYICILPLAILYQLTTSYYALIPKNEVFDFINSAEMSLLKHTLLQALPFFLLGAWLWEYGKKALEITKLQSHIFLIVSMILWVMENLIIMHYGLGYNIYTPAMQLYPILALFIWALKNPCFFSTDYRQAAYCRKISAFVYYIHPFFIFFIPKLSWFLDFRYADLFIVVAIASIGLGSIIYFINNKYLNHVFD